MSRRSQALIPNFPYHVSARCINKDWFGMPLDEVWELMEEYLFFICHAYGVKIHSFVLMNNHFHLLITALENNLSQAMQYFLSQTGRLITKPSGRINQTWSSRFFRSQICTIHYFLNAYKYVYRNPVEAGLCNLVEEYPYSTLGGLLGQQKLFIPVISDETLFSDLNGTLSWLNKEIKTEDKEAIKLALRRQKFQLPRKRGSSRFHKLETQLC